MSAEGVLKLVQARVSMRYAETMSIWPIGDVHHDSRACDRELWRDTCKTIRSRPKHCTRMIGTGDLSNFASSRERDAILHGGELHQETVDEIHEEVERRRKALLSDLEWSRGQWLGMVEGNHGWLFPDGTTATQRMCRDLGCAWLGTLGYIVVSVSLLNGHHANLEIVAHHGKAGGKLIGTSINQVGDLRTIFPGADLYIQGHDHQKGAWPVSCLAVRRASRGDEHLALAQKEQYLCRSGSFLRAYQPDRSSYAVGRLLRPACLGAIEFKIKYTLTWKPGRREIARTISAVV